MPTAEELRQTYLALTARHTGSDQQRQALLYADLRKIAHRVCCGIKPGETLQTTALLHEAWMSLANHPGLTTTSRDQFLALAGTVMHRIAVDNVRRRTSLKRAAGVRAISFEDAWQQACDGEPDGLVLHLDEGLQALQEFAAELADLVRLLFFVGLTQREIADYRGVSERTVRRDWRKARAWLYQYLSGG